MAEYQTAIIVDAPLEEVYSQWTQFEEFPRFMDGVLEVKQLDDKRLFWRARIGGVEKEWEAEITDQTPNRRIAWKSVTGTYNAGAVLFEAHLRRFRQFMEDRQHATGAWRGEIHGQEVQRG